MKNNRGFTIIEVAVSFILVATVSLILLQLVLSLKEVYLSGDVKTTLLNKQGIMTRYIYDDLNSKDLSSVTSCGLSCITFTFGDRTTKNLLVDPGNNTISYGDYTSQIDSSSYFDQITVTIDDSATAESNKDDSILVIDIPIISKLLDDENFGFHIVKTYNRASTTIDISSVLDNTKVTLSGVDSYLYVMPATDTSKIESVFVKVFHQNKNNKLSSDFKNFIKNKNSNTFSTLISLEALRMKGDLSTVTEGLSDEDKEVYQDGYLSFLLIYDNQDISTGNYARWYQTNNIAKKETLAGFYPVDNIGNGFTYNKSGDYWSNIVGKDSNIGIKSGDLYNLNNQVATEVDLYSEAREYICKYAMTKVYYNDVEVKDLITDDGSTLCPDNNS